MLRLEVFDPGEVKQFCLTHRFIYQNKGVFIHLRLEVMAWISGYYFYINKRVQGLVPYPRFVTCLPIRVGVTQLSLTMPT